MDRMPKEYKIAVYILFISLSYFVLFSATLFFRFKVVESTLSKPILMLCAIVFLVYLIPSILLLLRKEISRKFLTAIITLNILVNIIITFLMLNFKSFAAFLMNKYKVNAFTPYLVLGIARLTPEKIIAILLIQIPWLVYLIYLLLHRETKEYLKKKEYPLVNNQRYTLGVIILLFITITIVSIIFGL
ncbi:hypothetical protein [Caldisericum exile]|uniref:Uncharacterized protein n=1 Tax=Caldisericum exile (strain DSM 21853 / NBRC 104410 / AZM16c01) TaxID=511051 RepID=A0A7U6GEF4_CALEA|nr:hypothetical protein [Caldisericum exile]BAL80866.1 hypothetical protein CSE_07400 [Caldisericum exile AZM16c01]